MPGRCPAEAHGLALLLCIENGIGPLIGRGRRKRNDSLSVRDEAAPATVFACVG